ncbi:MAG: hypothetical protein ACXQTV_02765 [Candidatus Hecatellaceae archaeon]
MGFSTIFAVAILGILFLFAAGITVTGLAELSKNLEEENLELAENLKAKNETSIEIVQIEPVVSSNISTLIYVEILNSGSTSIYARHFKYLDLILKYEAASSGETVILWVPYSPLGGTNTWTVVEVKVDGGEEILNPIRMPASTGQWDPGETLKLKISLAAENAVDASPGKTLYVLASTPNGVKALAAYVFEG